MTIKNILIFAALCIGMVGCATDKTNGVRQTVMQHGHGTNFTISTNVWVNDQLVWAHYTWMDVIGGIPIDSVPIYKERDRKIGEKVYSILKTDNHE